MILSMFDICLLFNNKAIIDLQIDNSFIVDIIEFMKIESRELYVVGLVVRPCEKLISK